MTDSFFDPILNDTERTPLTVSELNAAVRSLLEREFAAVWVEGEIVNFVRAASGHWYFNLNDGSAQIRCVCWKSTASRMSFRPENGMSVRVRGRISLYEPRGEFQLVTTSIQPAGEGALRAAFEQILARLAGAGLFAQELKRPIPFFPRRIGVVTSPSGAAFHDILNVLTRRAMSISIVLAPALVQGEGSAESIRNAIESLNLFNRTLPDGERIDVLIVGRGGGSAEDLWAFNDEFLARAIRASEIPIISAVGHEIDTTIADHIADLRAATPSAAAEIVAAREADLHDTFVSAELRMFELIGRRVDDAYSAMDDKEMRLQHSAEDLFRDARERYSDVSRKLSPEALSAKLVGLDSKYRQIDGRHRVAFERLLKLKSEQFGITIAKLDALSPLNVLKRGYSITEADDGTILRDPADALKGSKLIIRLEKGTLDAEVV